MSMNRKECFVLLLPPEERRLRRLLGVVVV